MALQNFNELVNKDVSKHVQKKPTFYKDKESGKLKKKKEEDWLDYLEWSKVIELLYHYGAEKVRFGSIKNEQGYPAFYREGKNPFVRVWVDIDGDKMEMDFPVINGNKVLNDPDQLAIHIAQQRGMVKCVAINTGLGLRLWQNEESIEKANEEQKDKREELPKEGEKYQQAVKYIANGGTFEEIEKKYKITEDVKRKIKEDANVS